MPTAIDENLRKKMELERKQFVEASIGQNMVRFDYIFIVTKAVSKAVIVSHVLAKYTLSYSIFEWKKTYLDTWTFNHCSLETPNRVIGKQWRPRSDAAICGILSGSPQLQIVQTFFSQNV